MIINSRILHAISYPIKSRIHEYSPKNEWIIHQRRNHILKITATKEWLI